MGTNEWQSCLNEPLFTASAVCHNNDSNNVYLNKLALMRGGITCVQRAHHPGVTEVVSQPPQHMWVWAPCPHLENIELGKILSEQL